MRVGKRVFRAPAGARWEREARYLIKIVFFWGYPPFWSIFHDLERIFTKNGDFPVPAQGGQR